MKGWWEEKGTSLENNAPSEDLISESLPPSRSIKSVTCGTPLIDPRHIEKLLSHRNRSTRGVTCCCEGYLSLYSDFALETSFCNITHMNTTIIVLRVINEK